MHLAQSSVTQWLHYTVYSLVLDLSEGRRCNWLRSQCLNLGMIMKNPNNDLLQNFTYKLLYPYGSD